MTGSMWPKRRPLNVCYGVLLPALGSALLLSALAPAPAAAFVRTTTCESICTNTCATAGDGVCSDGGDGSDATAAETCEFGTDCSDCGYRPEPGDTFLHCRVDEGEIPQPIAWPQRKVSFYVHPAGSDDMDAAAVELAATTAFAQWGGVGCAEFELVYGGLLESEVGHDPEGSNNNIVAFTEQNWSRTTAHAPNALALTHVTYEVASGIIVDADIEMNGDGFTFADVTAGQVSAAAHDLQNTLTHEVGHFVGLDHATADNHVVQPGDAPLPPAANNPEADAAEFTTMAPSAQPNETLKRTLTFDDEAGLCEAYPVDDGSGSGSKRRRGRCSTAPAFSYAPLWLALGTLAFRRRRK